MVQLGLIWDFEGHYFSLIYSHYKDYFASICSQAFRYLILKIYTSYLAWKNIKVMAHYENRNNDVNK